MSGFLVSFGIFFFEKRYLFVVCSVWDLRSGKVEKTLGSDIKFSNMQATLDEKVICATSGKKAIFFDVDSHNLVKSFDLTETLSCAT